MGKWYMEEMIDMTNHWNDDDIYNAVRKSIIESCATDDRPNRGESLMENFLITVEDPYHKNPFPVILVPEPW